MKRNLNKINGDLVVDRVLLDSFYTSRVYKKILQNVNIGSEWVKISRNFLIKFKPLPALGITFFLWYYGRISYSATYFSKSCVQADVYLIPLVT